MSGQDLEKSFRYIRHRPEKKLLYKVVANNLETWLENRRMESASSLPEFVETSLRSYLSCGILEQGFILVSCDECENAIPVAHSCKRHSCPSCAAKRSAEISSHLIDNVLPHTPYRQKIWMARACNEALICIKKHAAKLINLMRPSNEKTCTLCRCRCR